MFGGWDAALVNQDYEINWLISPQYEGVTKEIYRKVGRSSFRRKSRFYRHTQSFYN